MLRRRFNLQGSESSGGITTSRVAAREETAVFETPAIEDGREVEDRLVLPQIEDGVEHQTGPDELRGVMTRNSPEKSLVPVDGAQGIPAKTPERFSMATPPDQSQEGVERGNLGGLETEGVGEMWTGGPQGDPASLGPVLDPRSVRAMEELQRGSPLIYTNRSQTQVLEKMRPGFLAKEEVRRQDETALRMEELERENMALKSMMGDFRQMAVEHQEMKKIMIDMMKTERKEQEAEKVRSEEIPDQPRIPEYPKTPDQPKIIDPPKTPSDKMYRTPEARSNPEEPAETANDQRGTMHIPEGGTVQVMLALMQGMQDIQRKLVEKEGRSEEVGVHGGIEFVRGQHELPKLPEWNSSSAPIDLNDWLVLIEPIMADLTASSQEWWETLLVEARKWYDLHVRKTPLERLTHHPTPSEELTLKKWSRLEKRAATMLLMGIPESQREELIATKQVTAMGIICRLFTTYQPGGLAEKEVILKALEMPQEAGSLTEAVGCIRKWMRWRSRAKELGVSEPDASILLRGLSRIIRKPLEAHRELNFRINLTRSMLQVDATPNATNVHQFATHVLAEMEQIAHAEGGRRGQPKDPLKTADVRMKKFEKEGEEKTWRKDQPRDQPCRFFGTDAGCRKGKDCKWLHQVEDGKRRCWTCGAVDHFSQACPRAKERSGDGKKGGGKGEAKGVQRMEAESPPKTGGGEIPQKDGETCSQGEESGEVMKSLLEEANRMLKNISDNKAEKSEDGDDREGKLRRLQRQLDDLKALRVFRIASIGESGGHGLLDSGATHALRGKRPGERLHQLPEVRVHLACGRETLLRMTPGGTMVAASENVEPIVPLGRLDRELKCKIGWSEEGLTITHPRRGQLRVYEREGCPHVEGLWL